MGWLQIGHKAEDAEGKIKRMGEDELCRYEDAEGVAARRYSKS